jgi:hypothetical protein
MSMGTGNQVIDIGGVIASKKRDEMVDKADVQDY